ncbi:MAG: hypothetical protein FWG40_05795 [Peptococcaceae bacterium]|nr:hypothetical protein [Peptococcaceae bacterium]
MKKVSVLLVVVTAIMLVLLTGCQTSRTPLTANEFKTKAEAAGYDVQDAKSQFAEGVVSDYLIAVKGTTAIDYQIEFAVVPTANQAIDSYHQNRTTFENKPGTATYTSANVGNYSNYYVTKGGRYYVISRIDNTFIYIDASADYKDEIASFLKELGY